MRIHAGTGIVVAFAVLLVGTGAVAPARPSAVARGRSVNAIVGDASWIERHGAPPPAGVDEVERIRTHLTWVIERLAATTPPWLSPAARANRAARLADLARYAARGEFPHLDAPRADRTPRFVDGDGRWCAVGFLIAITAGEPVARDLAARHEYAYLDDLDDPRVDAWARTHGFTRRELAMIQPEYANDCTSWGAGDDSQCPAAQLAGHRLQIGFGLGGGVGEADGRAMTYLLWGFDVRYAITSYLAIGLADLGVRVGPGPDGNHGALVASPIVELSRWAIPDLGGDTRQTHLDVGLVGERVFADPSPPSRDPLAARASLGIRFAERGGPSIDLSIGAMIALTDGFVVDDFVSAGSIAPFFQFTLGFRP